MPSSPASKYTRYKRATAFFLDWLLRARGKGRYAGKRVQLQTLSDVVKEIAEEPTSLTPKLLQDLPKALAACQCAITLRERVAAFFGDEEHGHQHFLGLLRHWLDTLKNVEVEQQVLVEEETAKFESYYAVLEVDEDYFPDEESFVQGKDVTKKSKADRKKLFEEAFAEDLRLEVVCYFLELEELVEGIFNIYSEVKLQKRTMMEATVVGTLVFNTAIELTAKLQLRYPVLKTAEELLAVVTSHPSTRLASQMKQVVTEVRKGVEKDGTFKFIPGMLLHDFTNVWCTLDTFKSLLPPIERGIVIALPEGYFGENYGEERTPEYVFPDANHYVVLLAQQLPLLYNVLLLKRGAMGPGFEGQSGLVVDFLSLVEKYFETHVVTIPLVFVCICWMQSVAALQGDAGLSHNISLTFKHTWDLIKVTETTLPKHPLPVPVKGDSFHAILTDMLEGFKASLRTNNIARANPIYSGSQMMSNHMEFMTCLDLTPLPRAFFHLYNALASQEFLQRIPFFDEMLGIYDEILFSPSSCAAAVHGSYNRVYLLASRCTGSTIDAIYETGETVGRLFKGRKERPIPTDLSLIFGLMHNDMSFLKGASSKTMLKKATEVCTKEMFETRVLSRDLLTLSDDLKDAFAEMCQVLGREEIREAYMKKNTKQRRHVQEERALEYSVMLPLLSLIDAIRPDGTLDSRLVPAEIRTTVEFVADGRLVRKMCEDVAAIIESRFTSEICEEKYFTFPSRPDFANQEYGAVSFKTKTKNDNREQVFSELMEMMKNSNAPLVGRDLRHLKEQIKKDPELLGLFSRSADSSAYTEYDDLCTLLHQAAAGPAHDEKLVEWMIQLGALFTQPLHCRKEPRQRDLSCAKKLLPNTMAVHSAAIAGLHEMVTLILEADNLVDLNTATFHTKETLAHLVVKNGYRAIYARLISFGADFRIKDGNGRSVSEVTTDRKWSQDIAKVAASIEESCRMGRGRREQTGALEHYRNIRAERARKSVFAAQRDAERQRMMEDLLADSTVKPTKKKKGKKGSKAQVKGSGNTSTQSVAAPDASAEAVPDLLATLLGAPDAVTTSKGSSKASDQKSMIQESLKKTMSAFTRLRDRTIAVADKIDDVQYVCKVIRKLDDVTEVQADPNKMIGTGVQLRIDVAFEASQVIHMMQKFYRVDHGAVAVPELAPVRELCATTIDFVKFVVRTAWICTSVDRYSQAKEILEVVEKRLLKTQFAERSPSEFREMVQTYCKESGAMGFDRTSSPDAFSRLEWYLINSGVSSDVQMALDKMVGRPLYFKFVPTSATTDRQFNQLRTVVDAEPELEGIACCSEDKGGKCVVYGGKSAAQLAKVRDALLETVDRVGIQFDERSSQPCSSSVRIGEFVCSAAGILRNAAGA